MQRTGLVWLLALAVLLSGCTWFSNKTDPAPGGLYADAVLEGTGIRFRLHGFDGQSLPELTVASADGKDWTDKVETPSHDGEMITAKLSGEKGVARLAVENFTYAWHLPDGRTLPGEIQFRDIRYRDVEWEVTRSEKLLIYHVKPLKKQDIENWESALEKAIAWTGLVREEPLVIWVFPNSTMLNEWARQDPSQQIAGQWMGADVQRLLVYDQFNSTERQVVMLHEMIHALSPGHGSPWYEEGMARLFEARAEREISGRAAPRWAYTKDQLYLLHKLAQQRDIATSEALGYSQPPTDPYTLGVSFWLFVKRSYGEEGVKRFAKEGGTEGGLKPTLEALYNKPLPAVMDEWNAYLRSDFLLQDWEQP